MPVKCEVIYIYRSERKSRITNDLRELEDMLTWIERAGAKLVEVKGEGEESES